VYEVYVTRYMWWLSLHRAFEKKNNESFLCDKDNFVGKLEYSCNIFVNFFRPKTSCFVFVGREEFN